MQKNLAKAKKWAERVSECVFKVEKWSGGQHDIEKVQLEYINQLLSTDHMPCNGPEHIKLKVKSLYCK